MFNVGKVNILKSIVQQMVLNLLFRFYYFIYLCSARV